mmetsp:Transcript_73024/g.201524  ORF Transcript_73024/g.201524 Transcript_73024/m.201524 type:complete len:261 (-) Transcript_73024:541-1323(-)
MVLVQHVRSPRLHLCLQDAEPELLCLDRLMALASSFQVHVHPLKFLAPHVHEALACGLIERLIGTEQRPFHIVLDAAHEQVRHPKAIEEVACTLLLFPVVLPQLDEIEDVCVPGLQVNGKRALALAAALMDKAGRLVEVAQQWHQPIAVTIGAADVGALRADVRDCKANTPSRLGDQSALLQGVVYTLNAVVFHREQEAGGHLGHGRAGIEERRRRVCEKAAGHQVVRLDGRSDVAGVDTTGNAHQHLLGPLEDLVVHAQ